MVNGNGMPKATKDGNSQRYIAAASPLLLPTEYLWPPLQAPSRLLHASMRHNVDRTYAVEAYARTSERTVGRRDGSPPVAASRHQKATVRQESRDIYWPNAARRAGRWAIGAMRSAVSQHQTAMERMMRLRQEKNNIASAQAERRNARKRVENSDGGVAALVKLPSLLGPPASFALQLLPPPFSSRAHKVRRRPYRC